ncbi:MAG: MFS transporter, partial [Stackebrandtia sp.]
ARAIGAWSGLGGVAAAAGPFLGGWLVDAINWRWVFFINVPLVALAVAASLRWVPETRDTTATGRFDLLGSGLGAVFLGGLTFALIQFRSGVPAVIAAVIAVAAGIGFAIVERRGGNPVLPPAMFANRQFSAINTVTFFVYASLGGVLFFLVLQLQVVSRYSALQAGITMLPFTLLMLVFSARAGALGDRIGPRLPLSLGPLLSAVGVVLLLGVDNNAPYWTQVFPGVMVLSVGMTLTVAPLTAGVLAATDMAHAGVASGINNAVARAASLLAVAALPLIAGLTGDAYDNPDVFGLAYQIAIMVCAGLFIIAAVVGAALVRNPAEGETTPTRPA